MGLGFKFAGFEDAYVGMVGKRLDILAFVFALGTHFLNFWKCEV
jgi:hypothetical protein